MNGKGGVYIKKLIEDGALKEDFTIELLGIYSLEECLSRETELAKTSLFPKGLNGNAGKCVKFTEETRQKMSNKAKERVANGTHNLLSGEIQRQQNKIRVETGIHQFLKGFNTSSQRVKDGTHHLLSGEIQRRSANERVTNGTHNFLHRPKGFLNALNKETGVIIRISVTEYKLNSQIYLTTNSKEYKKWKEEHEH